MELLGIIFITSTIALVTAVTLRARHAQRIQSSNPLDFALPIDEAYKRLFSFVSMGSVGAHEWTLRESVENLQIIAELKYQDERNRESKALINFDFAEAIVGRTIVRWSCVFLTGTDKKSAVYLQTLVANWIDVLLTPQVPMSPSAVPADFPALGSAAKADLRSDQAIRKAHPAEAFTNMLASQKKLQLSPQAQEFSVKLADAYGQIHKCCAREPVGHYSWNIKEAIEDAYIIGELMYDDKQSSLKFEAELNMDFMEVAPELTKIRWSGQFIKLNDRAKAQAIIDSWLRTCISPLLGSSDASNSPELPPRTIVKRCNSKWPKDYAYSKTLQKISGNNEVGVKWTLKECFKGRSIKADLVHTSSKKPEATCKALMTFEFIEGEKSTLVSWTYQFSDDSDPEIFPQFSALTDEWLELVLRQG